MNTTSTSQAASDGVGPLPSPSDLHHWRQALLDRWLRVALLAGLAPAGFSIASAAASGNVGFAIGAAVILAVLAMVAWARNGPFQPRAWTIVATLFILGTWIFARGGSLGTMYLLACPVATVLLLGPPQALAVLAACVVSVVGTGVTLDPDIPGMIGLPSGTLLTWLTRAAHLLSLGLVLVLSCATLLRRLDESLSRQRSIADSLQAQEHALRQVTATVPGMVFRVRVDPQGQPHYHFVSPGSQPLFGLEPEQICADGHLLHRLIAADDRERLREALEQADMLGTTLAVDVRVRLDSGAEKWVHISSTEVSRGPEGVLHNGIMVDISERKASDAKVWQQANFDSLTGLPNRRMLRDRLEQAMNRSRRLEQPVALLLIDLDHFKEVNDTLGHDRGDQLLVEASRRILACVRDTDTVARMGGDEFAVVLGELGDSAPVDLVAARIISALGDAYQLEAERAYLTASIGVAHFPTDATDLEGLLKHADQAMYAAKDAGRNRFRHFTPALQDQAQQRMRLANDLRHALARAELQVVYQPIVDLATGRIHKAEALLRWHHPERGSISPALFIPIAEATGQIGEIGDWVFRTAAAQAQAWRRRFDPRFQISVNRSPVQFRNNATQAMSWGDHLASLGLAGDAIAVEITEGLLLDTGPGVPEQLLALRDAGIPVSLDDFGTGYCAMGYLQKFDIDYLKIDRSFVSGMNQGETSRTLCKAMIVMAHELGLKVVAEGVETAEQRDWLRAAGCDLAQGYLFARPMAAEDFDPFMARHSPLPAPLAAPQPSPAHAAVATRAAEAA